MIFDLFPKKMEFVSASSASGERAVVSARLMECLYLFPDFPFSDLQSDVSMLHCSFSDGGIFRRKRT